MLYTYWEREKLWWITIGCNYLSLSFHALVSSAFVICINNQAGWERKKNEETEWLLPWWMSLRRETYNALPCLLPRDELHPLVWYSRLPTLAHLCPRVRATHLVKFAGPEASFASLLSRRHASQGGRGREGGRSDVIVLNRKQLVNNPFRMIILFERRKIIFESFLFFL